ncbi:hypothetical protein BJP34_05265 [Moorena producens PAL-8-15-08-1]|uniref:Short-chain dehydrogenase n=1 Tax=Moorena producens PAL-8-15-08-1 TaxID=1458985 RepID=A0A1D8TMR4_9CYAN|nr:hybrid non-ribosomal peptide synthetase/type I polyketide synthase [Moorena producens]AOW98937.1 hypothetical protein BJP34_05265 [Moorena producens PAL-8-15-08-1]
MENLSNEIQKLTPLQRSFLVIEQLQSKLDKYESSSKEPIAIIGMGCRFPGGADNPESFWNLLSQGIDAISEIPSERWNIEQYYDPNPETPGKMYTRYGGFVGQLQEFDSHFFNIAPIEAISLDPQQRLLLEVSWEALEHAAIAPQQLAKTQTGVFMGICSNDYSQRLTSRDLTEIDAYLAQGNAHSTATGRLSYFLGLTGPSIAVDTACSSSLVSLHLACASLRNQECTLALAGGVNRIISPEYTINFSRARMLSADGRCKTFDAGADGFVRSEGCGVVVLKRFSDAVADGDNILAVIRGTAINQDGHTSGLTVPNGPSQESVIRQALKNSGVQPQQVSYIEAHGTGTSLGDPIEVTALGNVFGESHSSQQPMIIGSVKTNIGHLEAAAGIAGLIKVVLQLQHQQIAPHLHFHQPNPYINWKQLPVLVPTDGTPWQIEDKPRLAGLSSFGFSGTNAHVILEEAPSSVNTEHLSDPSRERPVHLFTLSTKDDLALWALVQKYQEFLENNGTANLADICFTANTGRSHFQHRLAIIASNQQELAEKLAKARATEDISAVFTGHIPNSNSSPKMAFLFTGQGSQYVNMGRQLYDTEPIFRQALDQCHQILQSYLEKPLKEVIYPQQPQDLKTSDINQTAYTQPALFAIEYALFKLWESWGINPDVVMGHSVGEYVAATVAGVFSLEDGLKLIATRGRLMQQLPCEGEMVSVMTSELKVRQFLKTYTDKVAIAAINGPLSVVISGASEDIGVICDKLEAQGIKTKRLQVSHAFHSPLMEPMLAEFEAVAHQITYYHPKIPLISNVTGTKVDKSIATANYWVNHIRQPVKFAASMVSLQQQGLEVFLEIGAKPILLGMGRQCLPEEFGIWLPSLRPGVDEWQQMLSSLGQLYVQGVKVDWSGFDRDYARQKVVLPTYPFQRQRYWVETAKGYDSKAISSTKFHALINQKFQSPLSKEIFFESEFSTQNYPFLADHRIYEKVVVPGAAHISLLLAAASLTFPKTECQLEDILFPQALAIPEQGVRTVQVALTPQDSSYSFQVISFDDSFKDGREISSWAVHGTGKISPAPVEKSRLSLENFEIIKSRCSQKLESTEVYQYIWERQIQLGQSFRWIDQVWLGNGEVLCEMKVPQTVLEATKYQLHPALLDSCFQSVVALHLSLSDNNKETFVPFSVEKFTFYKRPENGRLWCYTRRSKDNQSSEKLKADIQLVDHNGELVAQVTGFEGRKANPQTLLMTLGSDLSNWFYEINWQAIPLPSTSESNQKETGNWLVFALTGELTEGIGKILEKKGHNCIWVSPGSEYQQLDAQHYQINPTVAEQFQKLLQDNSDIKGIVHLWGVNETSESVGILELEKAQELGCGTVLHLVQALIQAGLTHLPPMWLVTQGTQSVLDETEVVQPQQGALWGLGRVISLEHPELACFRVDLDPKFDVCETLPSLVDELLSNQNENQIAIRQGVRYVARLVRQQQQKFTSLQLSIESEACYLITGGLGALGLQVARLLVAKSAKHLVLIGRCAPSEMAMKTIQELEQAGSQISVLSGDISNQQDTVRMMKQIQGSLPPLKGVIHAAGVLDDGLLQNMNWQKFTKVMAPKVAGTWYLHQLTLDLPLDFFVCFSSMASMLGSPGQGNYAAANAFMDAIAHYRRGQGLPGLSINWGPWAAAGMAARLDSLNQQRHKSSGMIAIKPEQGMQALGSLLSESQSQVGVFPINWSRFVRQLPGGQKMPFLEALISTEPSFTQKSAFREQLEAAAVDERQELLTTQIRSVIAKTLGLPDAQKIGMQQPLFELGLDSLMAVELKNRLESSLETSLSSTLLFDYPTVEELVEYFAKDVIPVDLSSDLPTLIPNPEQRYQPFPLNDIQQAYWIGRNQIFDLGNIATHVYLELDCENLNLERLNQAWRQLIEHHDMLRMIILDDGNQQIIDKIPPYEIEVLNLSGESDQTIASELETIRNQMSHEVLPTNQWPLFNLRATRLNEQCFRLHISLDMLISDAWSIYLLCKQWVQLYKHPESSLPAIEISFRDYVLAESALKDSPQYLRSQQYWFDRLDSLPPAPEIPQAKITSAITEPMFNSHKAQLSQTHWQQLKHKASQANLTPSGILLSAFAYVLNYWSKSPKFTLNLTLFNRLPLHPQVNELIGDFTSVILLEVDNSEAVSFISRAQKLQRQLWEDLEHRYISGVEVQRELYRRGRSQPMGVVFTSTLGLKSLADEELGRGFGLEQLGEVVYTTSQTPQVLLDHIVTEENGALAFTWYTVEGLFPESLIDQMFEVYCDFLERLATSDQPWVETYHQLLPASQLALQAQVNQTAKSWSEDILHSLFLKQVQLQRESTAVITPQKILSYGELHRRSHQLGHGLRKLGVKPNQLVAVVMEKGWEQVVAVLGILMSGGAYLPIDPRLPQERQWYLLEQGEVEQVLTQTHLKKSLSWPDGIKCWSVDTEELAEDDPTPLEPVQTSEDLAYVIYTSGSTGLPKGVMIDHRGAVNTINDINQRFEVKPSDRVLALAALNFDLSVYDIFGVLGAGGAIVMPPPEGAKDPACWIELIVAHQVTLWNSVPALIQMLVEHLLGSSQSAVGDLRVVMLSGDWLPVDLPEKIQSLWFNVQIMSLGGATEASIWSIGYSLEQVGSNWKSIPYGKPLLNQSFYVLNELMEPRPVWVPGQLYIGGVGLALGYWKNEQKTKASFITHPVTQEPLYKTGDLGRYLPDGNIEFLGREDFQVKINGYRVELGEIEVALKQYPGIKEAVVSAVGEDPQTKQLVAYVVFNQEFLSEPQKNVAEAYQPSQQEGVLTDPLERMKFKLQQPGLEQLDSCVNSIELPKAEVDESLIQKYLERQSYRQFLSQPLSLRQLSKFLSCLQQMKLDDYPLPKYRYPSAGSLYPVQTYLWIKPNRVEGLEGGLYYYHPAEHRLILLARTNEIDGQVYGVNQAIFAQSAFSIFLIGKLNAIAPMYGELAKDFCMLEAGHLGQLLMSSAPKQEIGLCPIGHIKFKELRDLLKLESSQVLLYSFVGGKIDLAQTKQWFEESVVRREKPKSVQLREYLQQKLPGYMVPFEYIIMDTLPLTANGKVDRKRLPIPQSKTVSKTEHIQPHTKIEQQIAGVWREVIEIEEVGIHDNFFAIGGNSLLVIRVHNKLQELLGIEIKIVELFTNPTVHSLSQHISQIYPQEVNIETSKSRGDERSKKVTTSNNNILKSISKPKISEPTDSPSDLFPCLIPIQPEGNKSPFFCLPPVAGVVFPYLELARLLGKDRPFYGIQSLGFMENENPLISIEEKASYYIKAIKTVQPDGPYYLGGWSLGVLTAFEMARQLEEIGEVTERLILIDMPPNPKSKLTNLYVYFQFLLTQALPQIWPYVYDYVQLQNQASVGNFAQYDFLPIQSENQPQTLGKVLKRINSLIRYSRPLLRVMQGNTQASFHYTPKHYTGKITLLRTSKSLNSNTQDTTLGWSQFSAQEVETHLIPGHHLNLLRQPHVKVLAQTLKNLLK